MSRRMANESGSRPFPRLGDVSWEIAVERSTSDGFALEINYPRGDRDQLSLTTSDARQPLQPQTQGYITGQSIEFSSFHELKYTFKFSGEGRDNQDPSIIIRGNDITLQYTHRDAIYPGRENSVEIEIFEDKLALFIFHFSKSICSLHIFMACMKYHCSQYHYRWNNVSVLPVTLVLHARIVHQDIPELETTIFTSLNNILRNMASALTVNTIPREINARDVNPALLEKRVADLLMIVNQQPLKIK
uniref:Laminin IV type A domain-containing protein n=1 Tax=Heterorhabditis bacteriophora TaxID=37862 RepID=A0A1I7WE53_HETBA